jgi:molybdate transport system substrate-binding protein
LIRGAALALVLLALAGCGDDADAGAEPLTVYAASSLTEVFQELALDHRYNFAGSDELATQIREGGDADIYAAASPRYPGELAEEGLVDEPRVFATNRLVLIVPKRRSGDITRVDDLVEDGVKLVIGAEGVPVGDYTRDVLENLGRTDILEQVVSEEENVKGVVSKVALGEADAGFVYATDAITAGDKVTTIELPQSAQADVRYPVAVVERTEQQDEAEEFVELLLGSDGRDALERAGFGLP